MTINWKDIFLMLVRFSTKRRDLYNHLYEMLASYNAMKHENDVSNMVAVSKLWEFTVAYTLRISSFSLLRQTKNIKNK